MHVAWEALDVDLRAKLAESGDLLGAPGGSHRWCGMDVAGL